MLTDIFAARYASAPLWQAFGDHKRKASFSEAFKFLNDWELEGPC